MGDFTEHCARRCARAEGRSPAKGLRRGKPLTRRTRLRPRNPERARWRSDEAYGQDGARGHAVRLMVCLAAGKLDACSHQIEAAHVTSRARGGGDADLVPLCTYHHQRQHSLGLITFERLYRLDLAAEARRIADALDQAGIPKGPTRARMEDGQ